MLYIIIIIILLLFYYYKYNNFNNFNINTERYTFVMGYWQIKNNKKRNHSKYMERFN